MTDARYVLAIDLGTSGPKVALVSDRGELVGDGFAPVDLHLLPGGGAEQDPDQWWEAIKTATRDVLADEPVPLESITAVAVTSQWSGTVAIDADGRAIGNAIIWMDSRGATQVEAFIGAKVRFQGYDPASSASGFSSPPAPRAVPARTRSPTSCTCGTGTPTIYAATTTFLEPEGLPQSATDRQAGGIIRFDRSALGNRQPRPGRRCLRR